MRKANLAVACLSAVLLPLSSSGQSVQISYQLSWEEVDTLTHAPVPNPNGILEPGESVRLIMRTPFTPDVGTQVSQAHIPGGSASVLGLNRTGANIGPATEQVATWSGLGASLGLTASFLPMFDGMRGVLSLFQDNQGGAWLPTSVNPPAAHIVWTPASYEPRDVAFNFLSHTFGARELWGQYGTDPQTGHPLLTHIFAGFGGFGSPITVPIVPAPGVATPILLGLFGISRRKRR
jgi:hypothetical protein